ncbi:MAG: hypothetical protein ACE5GT_04490, partial [Rhodospirillales bacterium]
MDHRFGWTLLLTLVAASLAAAPLTVLAQDAGLSSFGLRGADRGTRSTAETGSLATNRLLLYPRAFA